MELIKKKGICACKGRLSLLIVVAALLLGGYTLGQAIFGTIIGTVTDASGAVIPGAEVTIENVDQGASWALITDNSGTFRKERLVPGSGYKVTVALTGFKSFVREKLTVTVDEVVDLKVVLGVGDISEVVTVSGTPPPLKTEKTDVAVVFDEKEVSELPIFERNFTRFLLLTPGTQTLGWQHASSENPQGSRQIMVNGQHFSGTGFELDGTSNRDPILGIIVINPTLESVTEAKVTAQNYDAEFGQATAGVVTTQTKSGTNDFHGSAFLFRRNDEQQARNPFSQTNRLSSGKFIPDTLWSQFGGSIGGPVIKDKAFFFFDYQGTRRKNGGSVLTTTPLDSAKRITDTPFGRGLDLSGYTKLTKNDIFNPFTGNPNDPSTRDPFPGSPSFCGAGVQGCVIPEALVSPQALALFNLLPSPNLPGIANNFTAGGIEAFDDDAFNVRGDFAHSENLHIFGRYSFADFERSGPGAFGKLVGGQAFDNIFFAGSSQVRNQSIASGFDYTLSPTVLTDFRFGFFRYKVSVLPGGVGTSPAADAGIPNLNTVPGLNQDPIFTSGMPAFFIGGGVETEDIRVGGIRWGYGLGVNQCNCPLDESEQQWQWVNNWITTRGAHTFKFGADIRYAENRRIPSDTHRAGELSFGPERTQGVTGGGLGIATFLLGEVSNFGRFVSESTDAEERQKRWFFYGQDTWKVTDKVSFNFGLRWEIYFPESVTKDGRAGFFDPATGRVRVGGIGGVGRNGDVDNSFTNYAPRAGLTYQINEKSVLRLGYGRSFDLGVFGSTFGHAVTQNLPVLAQQRLVTDNFKSVFNLAQGPVTPPFPQPGSDGTFPAPDGVNFFVRPDQMRLPTLDAWNITYQQETVGNIVFEVAYVGNKGTHVFAGDGPNYNLNQAIIDPNPTGPGQFTSFNSRQPFFSGPINGFGGPFGLSSGLNIFGNDASNNYHSLQAKVERRFSAGWSLLAHYTLGRAYQHKSDYYVWDAGLNYGPIDQDRKNVLVVNSLIELPFGRGKRFATDVSRAADAILGGWQVNFTTNWSSGLPFSPSMNNCGVLRDTGPCRPNLVGDPGLNGDRNGWFVTGLGPGTPWEAPAAGTFGTARVNSLRGPSFVNTDLSIFKNFDLGEEVKLQFRAEFFNLFNKVNLSNPNSCVNCNPDTDGQIFGLAPQTSMRKVQWALRLQF